MVATIIQIFFSEGNSWIAQLKLDELFLIF